MDEMSPSELRLRALELAIGSITNGNGLYADNDPAGVIKLARKYYNFIKPTNVEIAAEIDCLMDGLRDAIQADDDPVITPTGPGAVN